jgi:hypothetical protein
MTKIWGPLAWATLHSVAALYPDDPSDLEKLLLAQWIESFKSCIVCEKCRLHFASLLTEYRSRYPDWNASRKTFTLFVIRAHNTVNQRNARPILTLSEAFEHLRRNVEPTKAHLQRQSYILFVRRDWGRDTTLGGITAAKHIRDLIRVESEYWSPRSFASWDEVEQLVQGESGEPLPSSKPGRKTTIFSVRPPAPTMQVASPSPRIIRSGPTPRFSFLSR